MAGEIQVNSVTALTESGSNIVLNNVNTATNRTNLGLGSMATQAADSVSISGGTIGSSVVFPAGHIIQTVSFTSTAGSSTTNSQTLQRDTTFSGTINNVLPNSYVLILTSYEAYVGTNGSNTQQQLNHSFGLFRDTTNIFQAATDVFYSNPQSGSNVYGQRPIFYHYLDTAPATGTNVYYNGIRTHSTNYYTTIRASATPRFITLFEIAQ